MTSWQPIASAPKDIPILVYYDHEADPYQDPQNPGNLTSYACHAEGGDFLSGHGIAIVRWIEGWHEDDGFEAAYAPYWMPAVWLAWIDGDYGDQVVNALYWHPLPPLPTAYLTNEKGHRVRYDSASQAIREGAER